MVEKIYNLFYCFSLGYRPFMAGIQGQLNLLNRLIQQQEQEQIPESPSPSPVLSTSGNSRSNLSRSRHSSTSVSTTAALEEERAHEMQHFDENGLVTNYNSLDKDENDSPQSTCRIS